MKGKTVTLLFKKYFSYILPEYLNKGGLIYHKNLEYFIRGLWFESSSFSSTSFTIEVFIQPLFVPEDGYILNIGKRIGELHDHRDIWWDYSIENETEIVKDVITRIKRDALPFLNRICSPSDFIRAYHKVISPNNDRYKFETYLYSLVLLQKYEKAESEILSFNNYLHEMLKQYSYLTPVCERLDRMQTLLYLKDYQSAINLLESYRSHTLISLKLSNNLT